MKLRIHGRISILRLIAALSIGAGVACGTLLLLRPSARPTPRQVPARISTSNSNFGHADSAAQALPRDDFQIAQASFDTPAPPAAGDAEPRPPAGTKADRIIPSQFARRDTSQNAAAASPPEQPPDEQMRQDRRQSPFQETELPSFGGNVDVQPLDQLGLLIVRGGPQDVEEMMQIIEKIQEISAGVEPVVRVFQLHRASATAVRATIQELYPTAVGRTGTGATAGQQAAGQRQTTAQQTSVLKQFQIAVNERSNTLIIQASPQMMDELAKLVERLDVDSAPTVNEVRVIQLKNAQATEVAEIVNQAVSGAAAGAAAGTTGAGATGPGAATAAKAEVTLAGRSAVLRFVPLDGESRSIDSGILDEVRVTAQIRTNSVVLSAPATSMELLTAIITELDKPPAFVASTKVFPLKNSDASNMRVLLAELFELEPTTTAAGGGAGAGGAATAEYQRPIAVAAGDQPPVSIRVAVDTRTNSLIVSGPENALVVVEAVIKRLDFADIGQEHGYNRKSTVYRLKNSQASDVATALTTFFTSKRSLEAQQAAAAGQQQTLIGAYQRLEQDVIVVALENSLAASLTTAQLVSTTATPDTQRVSNLLLISASPRYYDEVIKMIEQLDSPQPQVMIQVIIAQLTLNDDFEFGIELGLQDNILFRRGNTTTGSTTNPGSPGFNFNTSPVPGLGNTTLADPNRVGAQGISNFSLGRVGIDNLGGLIVTASSESVSALLRTLHANGHLEVVSRPQIMTLDGRTALVTVGESFPYVRSVNAGTTATTATVDFQPIGVTLYVKPSITPDDRIYMEVVPQVTELKEIVNVQQIVTTSGTINQQAPRTTQTVANTVVSVNDGQTIVLGGLIQKRKNDFVRKVPWVGDLPYVGALFRYTQQRESRQELIVVMTPHIIRCQTDSQRIKDTEISRVNWILEHTSQMHGDLELTGTAAESATGGETTAPRSEPEESGSAVSAPPNMTAAGATKPSAGASTERPQSVPASHPDVHYHRDTLLDRFRDRYR